MTYYERKESDPMFYYANDLSKQLRFEHLEWNDVKILRTCNNVIRVGYTDNEIIAHLERLIFKYKL